MYALDTNSVVHALKGLGRVRKHIESRHPAELLVPALVMYELTFGTLKSRNSERRQSEIDRLLSILTVLPFDTRSSDRAARVRFHLERAGTPIRPLDTLIAGTVLAHGAILVTHNVDEFSRVPGLQIEDWY